MSFRRLWIGFAAVGGTELIGPGAIHGGQNVWQSMGGMELGSILSTP